MKALLVHLSGSHRGDTQSFDKEIISIGCDPSCDVRFNPGIDDKTSDRHAEVFFDNCEYYLRDLRSARGTFVNGHQIDEIILKDDDILEIGEGGPKLRFHIVVAKGEVCKPFRVVYRDSKRKSRRFRSAGFRSTVGFVGEFSRGLLRDATPVTRGIILAGIVFVGFSVLLSVLVFLQGAFSKRRLEREIIQLRTQLTTDQQSRQNLEGSIAEERKRSQEFRAQHRAETQAQLAALQGEEQKLRDQLQQARADASIKASELETLTARLNATSRQINVVEQERSHGERIIKLYQGGVCFIQGAYRFVDADGKPLRYLGVTSSGSPVKDSSGQTLYSASGTAPIVEVNYSGTGFLVSKTGLILTNRHVADPGWGDDEAEQLKKRGFTIQFEFLRAFFPGVEAPFKLEVVKVSTAADVAVVKADLSTHRIPVLALDRSPNPAAPGQPVVLMGYPTGLDALLARLDDSVVDSVLSQAGTDPEHIAQELSRRGMIRPLATQGHLSDILPYKLIYDAQTAVGGSGGPLFNAQGKVIGINFAILSDFSGANFGVPIRYGLELMISLGEISGARPRSRAHSPPKRTSATTQR